MNEIYRTNVFSKQLRLFLRSKHKPVSRNEIYEAFGDDPDTRKRVKSVIANLASQGHITRIDRDHVLYISKQPLPGETADRVWEYWRQNRSFTAKECAKFTGTDVAYVKWLIRTYRKAGFVELIPMKYVGHDERHYCLKTNALVRPMPGESYA